MTWFKLSTAVSRVLYLFGAAFAVFCFVWAMTADYPSDQVLRLGLAIAAVFLMAVAEKGIGG